jgi:hypothetical protein
MADLTLNSLVYTNTYFSERKQIRNALTGPGGNYDLPIFLEMAHEINTGNRPDRHLLKLGATVVSSHDSSLWLTPTIHMVCTVPKNGGANINAAFTGAGNYLSDSMCDLISASNYAFMARFIAGGFD